MLPKTWEISDQARLIVYVSDDLNVKTKDLNATDFDLPSITLEIGLGRERKTIVNYYYREWTSGITGDNSHQGQLERFGRQTEHWRYLSRENKDVILLGDANLCALSWNNQDYPATKKDLANLALDYYLEESVTQLVEEYTRERYN